MTKDNREFVSEAEETLERIFEDLAELHEQRHARGEADPELVNRIFRSAHSLKGLAGLFGFDAIGQLAHRMEDILDGLRLGRVSITSPAIDLLDEGVSLLAHLMARLENGEAIGSADGETVDAYLVQIESALGRPEPSAEAALSAPDQLDQLDLDPSVLRALTEYEEHRLSENLRRGRHLALVDVNFEIFAFEEGLGEVTAAVKAVGELISTLPAPGAAAESQIRFSLLVATELTSERLANHLGLAPADVRPVQAGVGETAPIESARPPSNGAAPENVRDGIPVVEALSDETKTPVAERIVADSTPPSQAEAEIKTEIADESAAAAAPSTEIESLRSISQTVRVDIRKLDELMNLVGELAIQRNVISGIAKRMLEDPATYRAGAELGKAHKQLDRKLKELQSGVLDVRMVPLRQIFEKLSRVVRRLKLDMDKDVHLEFGGAETELDKLIVEQLADPLVHLVRNAFDHAMEPVDERIALGKDPIGTIRIRALQRGNHVVIEIEDDGRGMNLEGIRQRAIARGSIAASDVLSPKETLGLVFEAGFSTMDQVSETSGRGVGMDVVRSNLAEMGGLVDLASVEGEGTTVTITLPITLAIIQALVVGVGAESFAIPLTSVLETLVIEPEEIVRSEDREFFNLRGEPLLLRRLFEEFEIVGPVRGGRQFCVVLGLGSQQIGLLVDRLEGQQDAVIKSIKGPVQNIPGIAGATELGDRGAILVIDVSALVSDAMRRREAA